MQYIWDKICGWWSYSRIIFLQVAGALVIVVNELLPVLLSFDFETFFTHEISVLITVGIQIATIFLRLNTVGAVGNKEMGSEIGTIEITNNTTSPKAD